MQNILIIDDSMVQAHYLCSVLEGEEYHTTAVYNGHDGLEQALTGQYSLILLDVIMPDMDGFTLLQLLKENGETKEIPVIMITSLSDAESRERCLRLGAVDYITKPFQPLIVKTRVDTHTQLHQYQMQAMVDELTGVANRRSYEQQSMLKWQEAQRLSKPISICMFDIDFFKRYNDTYGHPAGDKVLAAVAATANSRLQRATDFFARYGGEEFVALILGDESYQAYEHMKSIRQAIEDLHLEHQGNDTGWVTVSIGGITVHPHGGEHYDTYLKLADTMLYDAKRLGRNQVVWSNGTAEQWREKESK